MKFEKFAAYRFVGSIFGVSAGFVISGFLWAFFALRGVSQPLVIHFTHVYDYPEINQIGTVWDLGVIAAVGMLIVLVNGVITLELEKKDWFLGKLLAIGTLCMSILIFAAFKVIIDVN
ncbi:MAG: hypothetical protein AAB652_02600 [Patescibacteria group bacterium]